jgi:hypothetical protein
MPKLPLRFKILQLVGKHEAISDQEIYFRMKPDYDCDGQFSEAAVRMHLHAMRANVLIEDDGAELNEYGSLIERFKIAELGKKRLEMLPRNASNL